ncbi:MAG TPA: PHP domain-containing protein [Candidatus Limnocylindrales bacterium]|nr:PHP domain-containing protein [Candidatus Limnocylindrales bacterium]
MSAGPGPRPKRTRRHDPAAAESGVVPPAPSTIDLHAHSTRSDGVLSPGSLIRDVAAAGVRLFSLTDHDTLAGYRDLTSARAVPTGMTLIPGVEINALVTRDLGLWEGELHILGFGMDPDDDAFEATLAGQRASRRTRFDRTVALLRKIGMPIDSQVGGLDTADDDALGRPTIARALIAAGFATSVEDAFSRIIGHGMPGYVRREGLGPDEAIHAIRAAGGLPVLAHFREAPARSEVIGELVDAGLGGLEVYYRTFDQPTVDAMVAIAREHRLVMTGGSDYHGDLGPYADSHARLWVPPEVGSTLEATLLAAG